MNVRVLITGSAGLIGTSLVSALESVGAVVAQLDLRAHGVDQGDIRDQARVRAAVEGVDGIVHLAAVSRVVWGERDPELCWDTNVHGLRNVLDAAAGSARSPWLIFASSREAYGQPQQLPATEEAPLRPVNIYGRSKLAGELLIAEARYEGVRACTIRLSNVYGSVTDHADRVIPAFARAAASGEELRVDGLENMFDFTHVEDVTRGVMALIELLNTNALAPPPIHFVTGRPTTLGELAELAVHLAGTSSTIRTSRPRDFDVARFVGDPSRAQALLEWEAKVPLEDGLARLIRAFREDRLRAELQEVLS